MENAEEFETGGETPISTVVESVTSATLLILLLDIAIKMSTSRTWLIRPY